jgi:CheY-like chemotaxis protein
MATVHSIVTAAGGGLGVQSELGEGTTIRAYFPAVAELASAEAATAATADAGGHGETILVAEDEAAVLRVVIRILERDNYSVLAAPNGTGALALATDHEFDLLLTDIVMPGISGLELARQVRQTHPEASVLFMSGYSPDLADPGHSLPKTFYRTSPARSRPHRHRNAVRSAGIRGLLVLARITGPRNLIFPAPYQGPALRFVLVSALRGQCPRLSVRRGSAASQRPGVRSR